MFNKNFIAEIYEKYLLESRAGSLTDTKKFVKYLRDNGWKHSRSGGSHELYSHDFHENTIAVSRSPSMTPGTVMRMMKVVDEANKNKKLAETPEKKNEEV